MENQKFYVNLDITSLDTVIIKSQYELIQNYISKAQIYLNNWRNELDSIKQKDFRQLLERFNQEHNKTKKKKGNEFNHFMDEDIPVLFIDWHFNYFIHKENIQMPKDDLNAKVKQNNEQMRNVVLLS